MTSLMIDKCDISKFADETKFENALTEEHKTLQNGINQLFCSHTNVF